MSSNLKSLAQIGSRIKYLLAVFSTQVRGQTISGNSCVSFPSADVTPGSVVRDSDDIDFTGVNVSAGTLYKDLGREIYVYDDNSSRVAVFRQVQLVSGPATEGVPIPDDILYVKTWSADGAGVVVARTG